MANLAEVERLLCERYNVRVLDGPLKEAIDAGDVAEVTALIAERPMYRWAHDIQAALKGPSLSAVTPEPEPEVTPDDVTDEEEQADEEPAEIEEEAPRSSRSRK